MEKKFNDIEKSLKEEFAEQLENYTFIRPCDRMDISNGNFVKYLKINGDNKLISGFAVKNDGKELTLKSTNAKFIWKIKFSNCLVFHKKIEHDIFKKVIIEIIEENEIYEPIK